MKETKGSFNVLASVEKHIQALKPLLPKQAVICAGEYPIKLLLKGPPISRGGPLPVFIEKSGDEIYRWIPRGFYVHHILGFEDERIETHFYYTVTPAINSDQTLMESLKKRSIEKLHGAVVFASVWDGIGAAALPALIKMLHAEKQDSLGIAVLPSAVQAADAQFNTYASLQACNGIEGATVLLIDRDRLETYEGVDRQGQPLQGSDTANYLVNMCLGKETLVDEVTELSKNFGYKLYTPLLVTGASLKIYGNLENMLNAAALKPFSEFDLKTASVLYVLIRMPQTLKDKLPLGKIELTIANWFKDKAPLKSIYITEPIYTSDLTDRVDLALFVGGFDTSEWFAELEKKSTTLKRQAIARGLITEDWQVVGKAEPQPEVVDVEAPLEVVAEPVEAQTETPPQVVEEQPKPQTQPPEAIAENVKAEVPAPAQPKRARRSRKPKATTKDETAEAEVPAKPKRSRRATKKASANST